VTAGNEVVFLRALGSERVAPRANELPANCRSPAALVKVAIGLSSGQALPSASRLFDRLGEA
jgi:hypothetical protein